jgi:hypothetical protein
MVVKPFVGEKSPGRQWSYASRTGAAISFQEKEQ